MRTNADVAHWGLLGRGSEGDIPFSLGRDIYAYEGRRKGEVVRISMCLASFCPTVTALLALRSSKVAQLTLILPWRFVFLFFFLHIFKFPIQHLFISTLLLHQRSANTHRLPCI